MIYIGECTATGSSGSGGSAESSQASDKPHPAALSAIEFDSATLSRLQAGFEATDQIRALLALDKLDGLRPQATAVKAALVAAKRGTGGAPGPLAQVLADAIAAADNIARSTGMEDAREHFASLTMALVALAGADDRLAKGGASSSARGPRATASGCSVRASSTTPICDRRCSTAA